LKINYINFIGIHHQVIQIILKYLQIYWINIIFRKILFFTLRPIECVFNNVTKDYDCLGFDFEDENAKSHPPVTKENLYERCELFAKLIKKRILGFRTKHILIPFGNDFRFYKINY
jgi:hypothetical protein